MIRPKGAAGSGHRYLCECPECQRHRPPARCRFTGELELNDDRRPPSAEREPTRPQPVDPSQGSLF